MQRFNPDGIFRARFCFFILGCLATIYYPSLAPAQQRRNDNLIEGARKDGEVVWYTTTSNEDNQAVVNGFNKKYPFVKVQVLRTSGEKLRERILTEASAGQHFFDVAVVSGMELGLLKSRSLLQPYHSPEAAVYPAGAKEYREIFWQK